LTAQAKDKVARIAARMEQLIVEYQAEHQKVAELAARLSELQSRALAAASAREAERASDQKAIDDLEKPLTDARQAAKDADARLEQTEGAIRAMGWPGKLSAQEKDRYDQLKREAADEKATSAERAKQVGDLEKQKGELVAKKEASAKKAKDEDSQAKQTLEELGKQVDEMRAKAAAADKQVSDQGAEATKAICAELAGADPVCANTGGILAVPREVHFKFARPTHSQ
jgi:chromosome segregation ATPase